MVLNHTHTHTHTHNIYYLYYYLFSVFDCNVYGNNNNMSQHNRIDSFEVIKLVTDYHSPHFTLSLKGLNMSLVIFTLNSLNLIL